MAHALTAEFTQLTVRTELLQETLIALRDRRYTLAVEAADAARSEVVRNIARSQLSRVRAAIEELERAVGEQS